MKNRNITTIDQYDDNDTTGFIDSQKPLKLSDLGIQLPKESPTKVISLRLPTSLLNKVKAYASEHDIPYSSMIKLLLSEGMERKITGKRGMHV